MNLLELAELKSTNYHRPLVLYYPPGTMEIRDQRIGGTFMVDNQDVAICILQDGYNSIGHMRVANAPKFRDFVLPNTGGWRLEPLHQPAPHTRPLPCASPDLPEG